MDNEFKSNKKKIILLCGFILFLIISITGSTYAYLAFSATNNSVVVGEIGVADLDLRVTKVTSSNGDLVPQLEKALGTAVSSTHNCVDGNGNTVCQIYKIEIENTGTAKMVVDGTIDFAEHNLPNLKYKLMTNATTLDTSFNSRYGYDDMEDRPMVRGLSLEPEQVEDYYIVFWINDTQSEQPDTGTYRASINFNSSYMEGLTSTYVNYLKNFNAWDDSSYFHNDSYKNKIKNVSFVNYIDTSSAVASWDMGTLQNGGIIAWVENNTTSGYYDLYIGANNEKIRGLDMSYFFCEMNYVDSINFSNLDTSEVFDMKYMFFRTGTYSTLFSLDLGDNFVTSNVTDMSYMFNEVAAINSSNFTLDIGDKFDTSNVVNMDSMFNCMGGNSRTFTLDLGDKFDTSNVVNMMSMFASVGGNNSNFVLDLGEKFDTINVTNMIAMFYCAGERNSTFTLNLGDKFDTSNVTSMENMFQLTGSSSLTFILDFGDKFNTLNVADMSGMFYKTGYANNNFELDLTTFAFDNVTSYNTMFGDFKSTQKIYVKNASDKAWLVGKFDSLTNDNVIVRS